MPNAKADVYPGRDDVIDYMALYEARYHFPIIRPVHVERVTRNAEPDHAEVLLTRTDQAIWSSKAVVSATGNWSNPHVPVYPGIEVFKGIEQHSANYCDASPYVGKRVVVVGGGNSGAQILAEVSKVAHTTWVTPTAPVFLPDDVDGRVLFERATQRWLAIKEGRPISTPAGGLGDIVMTPSVREARERGVLVSERLFETFTESGIRWSDGRHEDVDAVIWCTGFKPALQHLSDLDVIEADGKVAVDESRSTKQPRLWLVGYGDWTGPASATLAGVMRAARSAAQEISLELAGH